MGVWCMLLILWFYVIVSFAVLPLSFANAGDKLYDDDYLFFEIMPKIPVEDFTPNAYLFDVLGGTDVNIQNQTFLIISLALWIFMEMWATVMIIANKMYIRLAGVGGVAGVASVAGVAGVKKLFQRTCRSTAAIAVFQLLLFILQIIGFSQSVELLLVWPISNFLRFLDTLLVLFYKTKFKTKKSSCLWPHDVKDYNCLFLTCDVLGGGAGFLTARDQIWEKIVNVVIEGVDTIFAVVVEISNFGVQFSLGAKHFFDILKFICIGMKVAITFPNYVLMYKKSCSLITGCVLGVFAFVTMLLLELHSMIAFPLYFDGVKMLMPCVYLALPLAGFVILFSLVVMCCMTTKVPLSESVFFQDDEDEEEEETTDGSSRVQSLEVLESGDSKKPGGQAPLAVPSQPPVLPAMESGVPPATEPSVPPAMAPSEPAAELPSMAPSAPTAP